MVRGLDLDRLFEVHDLRALLEGFVVERATPNVDAERMRELRALEREMRTERDHARWLELNATFHRRLYEPSGAETTLELIDQLRARAERYARLWSGGAGLHRPAEAGREHVEILKLVEAGDGAKARSAIEEHIAHTRDRLVAHGETLMTNALDGAAGD